MADLSRALAPRFYHAPYPENMSPRQYQLAGAEFCLLRPHALIGDVPGTGKSMEAILVSNSIRAKRNLVICPASLILNWCREIDWWSTKENVTTYPVLRGADGVSHEHDYVVMSYAMIRNPSIQKALWETHWDHVICDEAHKLKDYKGNQTTTIVCNDNLLPTVTGRFTWLTGTPMPNEPIEIYNACRLLDWDCIEGMSVEAFRAHYYEEGGGMVRKPRFNEELQAYVTDLHWSDSVRNIPTNLEELQQRLRSGPMVRRTKEEVLPELPKKQWNFVPLQFTGAIKKAMRHPGWKMVEKLYELADDDENFDASIPVDGAISTARRELGEAKAPQIVEYVKELLEGGVEKVIVGGWNRSVLEIFREGLAPYGVAYMDGSTSVKRRQNEVDAFNSAQGPRVIVGQMSVLGEGWTLVSAADVVNGEFDWTPGRNDQLFDRIQRIGQLAQYVMCHVPIIPGTLDERITQKSVKKDSHIFQALDKRY